MDNKLREPGGLAPDYGEVIFFYEIFSGLLFVTLICILLLWEFVKISMNLLQKEGTNLSGFFIFLFFIFSKKFPYNRRQMCVIKSGFDDLRKS